MDTTELKTKLEIVDELRLAIIVLFVLLVSAIVYDLSILHIYKVLYCVTTLLCFVVSMSYLRKHHKDLKNDIES